MANPIQPHFARDICPHKIRIYGAILSERQCLPCVSLIRSSKYLMPCLSTQRNSVWTFSFDWMICWTTWWLNDDVMTDMMKALSLWDSPQSAVLFLRSCKTYCRGSEREKLRSIYTSFGIRYTIEYRSKWQNRPDWQNKYMCWSQTNGKSQMK